MDRYNKSNDYPPPPPRKVINVSSSDNRTTMVTRSCAEVKIDSEEAKNGYCTENGTGDEVKSCYYSHDLASEQKPGGRDIYGATIIHFCPTCFSMQSFFKTGFDQVCLMTNGTENPQIPRLSCRRPTSMMKTMRCGVLEGHIRFSKTGQRKLPNYLYH